MSLSALPVLAVLAAVVSADIYMQNPRGSNNRLDGKNRDRDNANRLFDSQNNNRGGVNVGSLYYYAGSTLRMEWSAQHSCGGENNRCELVVQYLCDDRVRDGTTTKTIPDNPKECYNYDCDTDVRYGRHESFDWYQNCKYRRRNKGLFTSSQQLKGERAIYTRQNPNGARRGYECPEERDYYPYWGPSPWRDVAIFTNDEKRCLAYAAESQNVKSRSYCKVNIASFKRWHDKLPNNQKNKNLIPTNQSECESLTYKDTNKNSTADLFGQWIEAYPHNIPAPQCFGNVETRDNHHGNTADGDGSWSGYEWKVPTHMVHEQCVLRLRYNISTDDFAGFKTEEAVTAGDVNASLSRGYKTKGKAAKLDIAQTYGLNSTVVENGKEIANTRGYLLQNNPQVDFMDTKMKLQLAVNTAQFGRTFQDRTHKFSVRAPPAELAGQIVTNINVRGKRGNIVQTYPSTEYDFVPNKVDCGNGDYVHFQWSGSNTNPQNNAGQGRQGTDRHNVVVLRDQVYPETTKLKEATVGQLGASYPQTIQKSDFLGMTDLERQHLAILDKNQLGGENSELDDRSPYYDQGPVKCEKPGVYNYMCTRNNNFSNRSQKGTVTVSGTTAERILAGFSKHVAPFPEGQLTTQKLDKTTQIIVKVTKSIDETGVSPTVHLEMASDLSAPATLDITYPTSGLALPSMKYSATGNPPWEDVEATFAEGVATAEVTKPGHYKVLNPVNGGLVFLVVAAVAIVVGGAAFYFYKKKQNNGGHSLA